MADSCQPPIDETSPSAALRYSDCDYRGHTLTIFVLGASGDLAKKKTFPSLFSLYCAGYLPPHTRVVGYARSCFDNTAFRDLISPRLASAFRADPTRVSTEQLESWKKEFLALCEYRHGAYDSVVTMRAVNEEVGKWEREAAAALLEVKKAGMEERELDASHLRPISCNRLFYFAIPPSVFAEVGGALKETLMSPNGWNRLILEKPFGKDLATFQTLSKQISELYGEDQIYRIDHYLGKEMVLNLMALRFANSIFEPLWNNHHISSVTVSFKEDFGTQGRGGYFDDVGIIRDVMQNHLLQVLAIVAMEPPLQATGAQGANYMRDEKVNVLKSVAPIDMKNVVIGQYTGDGSGKNEGYLDDSTVPAGSVTPTFATVVLYIDNARWRGVPFIIRAGKALNERKSEVRVQFREARTARTLFEGLDHIHAMNELVMRLQPEEAIYMKMNVKTPGLSETTTVTELNLDYRGRLVGISEDIPDAYTRLILEVLRGKQATFVRDDELLAAWKIFDPLLKKLDETRPVPIGYKYGSRGPKESDELASRVGYIYQGEKYHWMASRK